MPANATRTAAAILVAIAVLLGADAAKAPKIAPATVTTTARR